MTITNRRKTFKLSSKTECFVVLFNEVSKDASAAFAQMAQKTNSKVTVWQWVV